jgi:hypothetical protein
VRRALRSCLVLCLGLATAPALAGGGSGVDLSLHYGGDKYDAVGLRSGLGGVRSSGRLRDTSTSAGATVILRGGMGEIGLIGELGRPGQDGSTTLVGALLGAGFDTGPLRLELLGELGAHRYGDLLRDSAVLTRSHKELWLVSAGVRPGLTLRFGPNDMLLLGIWTFARWDVTSRDVRVTLASDGESTYRLGGAQYGAAVRAGFSL